VLEFAAATRLHRQLTELGELLAYAHLLLLPGSAPRGGRVSGATRTPPLPCRVDVLSWFGPAPEPRGAVVDPHGDQGGPAPVVGTLATWVRLIEEESAFADCEAYSIGGMLGYLSSQAVLAWTCRQPWADEYAAEVDTLHRRARSLSGTRARRRPLPQLACPRCDLYSLVEEDGRDTECTTPGCGVILRPGEVSARAEQILREMDAA
jgi:hypothetical protein